MNASIGPEQIDHILDELESLSFTAQSRREFYEAALSRLQTLLHATSAAYLIHLGAQFSSKSWSPLAVVGDWQSSHDVEKLCNQIDSEQSWKISDDRQTLIVSADSNASQANRLIALRLANSVDSAAAKELVSLIQAFAEILDLRNHREREVFFKRQFPRFQSSLSLLVQAAELQQAAMILVNELQDVLSADRVALVHSGAGQASQILAVSGVAGKILPTESAAEIQRVCSEARSTGRPVLRSTSAGEASPSASTEHTPTEHTASEHVSTKHNRSVLAPFYAAFPLEHAPKDDLEGEYDIDQAYVLFEWSDTENFLAGMSHMAIILPTLAPLWNTHSRWLRQPTLSRWLGRSANSLKRLQNRWMARAAIVAFVLAVAVWALTRPVDFRVEMQGVLEPVSQQTIYAAHDGYIDQLLVGDNSQVLQGHLVAVMRSPELELQIHEVRGELRANQEKHKALSLSLNQINNGQSLDGNSKQQSLGSELRQVDIQRQTLEQRLETLINESEKLNLTSPIQGVIVSRELARTLESRPIRRGDAVVRVADPEAKWRLALRIKDADVGQVKLHLSKQSEAESLGSEIVEFVIVANPTTLHRARLDWIANSTRNPDGQGVIVDAHADIEQTIETAQIGATVQAYIKCGQRPLWYVWSRPLWETIQRKLWF